MAYIKLIIILSIIGDNYSVATQTTDVFVLHDHRLGDSGRKLLIRPNRKT